MTGRIRLGKYLQAGLIIGDFAVINLVYWLVCTFFGHVSPEFKSKLMFLAVNAAYVPVALLFSHIHKIRILYADRLVLEVFKSTIVYGATITAVVYLLDMFDIGWLSGGYFMGLYFVLMSLWWLTSHALLKKLRRMGLNFRRVALVGANSTADFLRSQLQGDAGYGYRIMGIFDDDHTARQRFADYYTAPLHELREFVRNNNIDMIFYSPSGNRKEELRKAMEVADEMGIEFIYLPDLPRSLYGHFIPGNIGSIPSLTHTVSPLNRSVNSLIKRIFDICVSLPVVLTFPIWALPIIIGIKRSSPGPIFFKQVRTGIRGKDFTCLKFRTMRVNKDADKLQATENDPRKTKFGNLLRRTSIDELPQFFNVLMGHMSVVGPRPHMLSQTVDYSRLIDKYMVRHAIKPGITGWAQINGFRGETKHLWQMEKRVEYDVWYIHHWNFFLDVKIIFLTILSAFGRDKNAY
ncbi:MAG: exopolysaccharide biosynthesis polyprenyl glycosylphosphotransferase [Bacteroidales bacterium]|nr:exopolysaccharide biosynthesis polyprenyl glycosylphosphotransferase [Bacteroidales bacterium]